MNIEYQENLAWPLAARLTAEGVSVIVEHNQNAENPREWGGHAGTLLLRGRDTMLGDDQSSMAHQWRDVVKCYATHPASVWALAASLTANKDDEYWTRPETSEEVKWSNSQDVRVLIPVEYRYHGAGSEHLDYGEPVIGQRACRRLLADMLDGKEQVTGLYVITANDLYRAQLDGDPASVSVGKANERDAAQQALCELSDYDAYIRDEVFIITDEDRCETLADAWDYETALKLAAEELGYVITVKREREAEEREAEEREAEAREDWAARGVLTVA